MIKHITLLFLVAITASISASAQVREKLDFQLKAYLEGDHAPDAQVDLFIRGDRDALGALVRGYGGVVKKSMPGLVSARVPVQHVRALAARPAVEGFEFSLEPGRVLNDSMRVKNGIVPVHLGQPALPSSYDGTGVLMGIIDSGMDWQHPDFLDENGRTRVLKYWDQTLPINAQTPQPFNYGQVWDSTQINAGLMTSIDQPSYNGHGSTVTGTAAGNAGANGRHLGVAPGTDLIIVSASFGGNFRAKVADAVQYIFEQAEALGRPVVVNASLGSYSGSHDGQDAAALLIDELILERSGRIMVCAAGNTGNLAQFAPYHLRHEVGADTTFTWFRYNANSGLGYGAVFFEAWADIADLQNVYYAIGADRVTPSLQYRGRTGFRNVAQNLGQVLSEPLLSPDGSVLATVETFVTQRGGQYQLQVHIQQPDSSGYNFRFITTGSGKLDVWSSSVLGTSNMVSIVPTVDQYPAIASYVLPDNNKHMVDSWACSPHVLTVANYQNETTYVDYYGNTQTVPGTENDIALASSKGPTRDDRQKPDLAATGDITFSAAPLGVLASFMAGTGDRLDPGGWHIRNGGTSMASPVVAGAAALYLQKCPTAPHWEVMEAITSTARSDVFTGMVPNNRWGHGKLDAFAALLGSNLEEVLLSVDGTLLCEGSEVLVFGPDGYAQYTWSTGALDNPLAHGSEGPLSLQVQNASGCMALSDTLTFTLVPGPATPIITEQAMLTLISSEAQGYQWYLNGMPLEGEVDQVHVVGSSGDYHVEVFDANGCSALSDVVNVLVVGMEEWSGRSFGLWPSPAADIVHVQLPGQSGVPHTLRLIDAQGRVLATRTLPDGLRAELSVADLVAGTYTVLLEQGGQQWTARFVKLP